MFQRGKKSVQNCQRSKRNYWCAAAPSHTTDKFCRRHMVVVRFCCIMSFVFVWTELLSVFVLPTENRNELFGDNSALNWLKWGDTKALRCLLQKKGGFYPYISISTPIYVPLNLFWQIRTNSPPSPSPLTYLIS